MGHNTKLQIFHNLPRTFTITVTHRELLPLPYMSTEVITPHIVTKLPCQPPLILIPLRTQSRTTTASTLMPDMPDTPSTLSTELSLTDLSAPQTPARLNPSSDSSSSDSDTATPRPHCKMANQSKFASVDQDAPSKAPMLLPGNMTPRIMREFEDACLGYFENKEIALDKQVRKILAGLKDDCFREWLSVDQAHIHNLMFTEFMGEFRVGYLPKDWEQDAHAEVLSLAQGSQSFWDFILPSAFSPRMLF